MGRHLSMRPTRRLGRAVLERLPIWPCSDQGLPSRPGRPSRWWSLTPPFHPCLIPGFSPRPSAVCSLWHFPGVAPAEVSSVARPVESGLSSSCSAKPSSPRLPGPLSLLACQQSPTPKAASAAVVYAIPLLPRRVACRRLFPENSAAAGAYAAVNRPDQRGRRQENDENDPPDRQAA